MSDQAQAFRRLFDEGFTRGNEAVVDELMSDDFLEHQQGAGQGRDAAKSVIRQLHAWFSDFSLTIEDMVEHGDTIWGRMKGRGVNTGSVMGNPPTGRPVEVDVIDIIRFRDGKMVEHWGVPDTFGLLRQVGFKPGH